jgi:hypothetical protein
MAKGDAPMLEALADINTVSLERTELDPASLISSGSRRSSRRMPRPRHTCFTPGLRPPRA